MPIELPKSFDAKEAQEKWLKFWEDRGYFHSEPDAAKTPYTIVIPPPNVTGALHIGHALNGTIQDVLIRWKRMQGFNALWIPGTDHAGIATQAVVERLVMNTEKKTRRDLGRDELVKRIWSWKDKYEARILGQLRELGASCDWQRTRFTLDETCAKAVRETVFFMFKDDYIYRGKRLVNWDTQLQTSVADDETYTEITKGGFWTFKYPIIGMQNTFIQFSTTRPETMLGDTALCVHPDDVRFKLYHGMKVIQPLSNREIPIIVDKVLADPELGTGCVKVTPAHDQNDSACWVRHDKRFGNINMMSPNGTVAPGFDGYSGLEMETTARKAVIDKMDELGLFVGMEQRDVARKYSDRSKTPIQPYESNQWFVKMADQEDGTSGLAQMAIDAVEDGRVKFHPERYTKTYQDWLREKRDWCISRQLWWGHRLLIWEPIKSPSNSNEAILHTNLMKLFEEWKAQERIWWRDSKDGFHSRMQVCVRDVDDIEVVNAIENSGFFTQSEDVLDTWFSSALWPHSTLGWPNINGPTGDPAKPNWAELKDYYPTSTLCTSRDIITLWVARMVLMGLYNTGKVPFTDVYVHPKMLDGFGEGMSKSKGNGIDPLDIIELYGTDALRYAMVNVATETQDSRLPVVNVCPHCGTQVPVKQEHMYMRTKKLNCPSCKKAFRPGGPWPEDDPELPTAKQASDRFEIGRNFANKLWNATRFILMNLDGYTPATVNLNELPTEDRWIVSRLATTTEAVTKALESFKFAEVAKLIHDFSWSEFCDWYIEMSKGRMRDPTARPLAQRVLIGVLDGILRLVHPVMPFVSESLWQALNEAAPHRGLPVPRTGEESVCIAPWPSYPAGLSDAATEAGIARMQDLVRGIREIRNRYQVDKAELELSVKCSDAVAVELKKLAAFVSSLGGVKAFECGPHVTKPKQAGSIVRTEFEAYIALAGLIDPATETKRTEKQIAEIQKQLSGMTGKLANESYVKNAPPEVVEETRLKVAELENQIRILEGNLTDLQSS